jgi:hypothetical protein
VWYATVKYVGKIQGHIALDLLSLSSGRAIGRVVSWVEKPEASLGIDARSRYRRRDRCRTTHPTLPAVRPLSHK